MALLVHEVPMGVGMARGVPAGRMSEMPQRIAGGGACERVSNPAELLSMLTAHGVVIGRVPGRTLNALSPLDVAGAMGMARLTKYEQSLLRLKLCLEFDLFPDVANWVFIKSGHQHWALTRMCPGREVVRDLCTFTTYETVFLGHCPRCGGAGVHKNQQMCALCGGVGKHYHDDEWVAEHVLSLTEEQFQKSGLRWRRRDLSAGILAVESKAIEKIRPFLAR